MKSFITPTYTFTPGAAGVGTVNLSGIADFNPQQLVAIINQTRGVTIYATGDTALRYTAVSGTTVTLNADTSTHSSGDSLQVIYEVTDPLPVSDDTVAKLLWRILQMLMAPLGYDKSQGRQRGTVVLESGTVTTVSTVTTVGTVNSLANIAAVGGYSAQMQIFDTNRTSWAQCVRSRIS
jgi:hypothetical protein